MSPERAREILESGETLHRVEFSHAAPGMAGQTRLVRAQGQYFVEDEAAGGLLGPFDTLAEAEAHFRWDLAGATTAMSSVLLEPIEILARADYHDAGLDFGQLVLVNGESWRADESGVLRPADEVPPIGTWEAQFLVNTGESRLVEAVPGRRGADPLRIHEVKGWYWLVRPGAWDPEPFRSLEEARAAAHQRDGAPPDDSGD